MEPISAFKSIVDLVIRFIGYRKSERESRGTLELADRFLLLYRVHDILPAQIPRVLGMEKLLQPKDMLVRKNLIECLNNEMLDKSCELFGVRREWMDGDDIPPYLSHWFYKDPVALVHFLEEITKRHEHLCLWCFKAQEVPIEEIENGDLYAVLSTECFTLGEKLIEKFYPIENDWPWQHQPARVDFKALVYICQRFGIHAYGREAPRAQLKSVIEGKIFPSELKRSTRHWHPDDYIYTDIESAVAKDSKEAQLVREYLAEVGALQLLPAIRNRSVEKNLTQSKFRDYETRL